VGAQTFFLTSSRVNPVCLRAGGNTFHEITTMKILLPFDGSDNAKAALNVVLKRPWPTGTRADIITITEHVPIADTWMKLSPEEAKRLLSEAIVGLEKKFGTGKVTAKVVESEPRTEILELERSLKPDLIVMGSHGRHGLTRFLLGSLTDVVVNYAHSSVCVVRGQSNLGERKFLIALEGSKFSLKALEAVMERPWPEKAEFQIVSVVEPPLQDYSFSPRLAMEAVREAEKEVTQACQKYVDDQVARMRERLPGCNVTGVVMHGYPVDNILTVAKSWQPDCIIMGSRSRKGLNALLLGSVSKSVLLQSECSVEIIRYVDQSG
jgi:nucleotide-binding universal stress UspA family protein